MLNLITAFWTAPNTILGLLLWLTSGPGMRVLRVQDDIIEAQLGRWHQAWFKRIRRSAITLGIFVSYAERPVWRTYPEQLISGYQYDLWAKRRAEELFHARDYRIWGPFFIPAYLILCVVAWASGGDLYRDNWFEKRARAAVMNREINALIREAAYDARR